jgi:hypothetical protein
MRFAYSDTTAITFEYWTRKARTPTNSSTTTQVKQTSSSQVRSPSMGRRHDARYLRRGHRFLDRRDLRQR